MSSEQEVYVMRDADGDEWVRPTPVDVAIFEAVTDETDVDEDDLGAIEEYVDAEKLRTLLDGPDGESLTVSVEGYEVTIHGDGSIDVAT